MNKLARLLNSPSIKRVLLNDSLTIDFDEVIAHGEVLVVKGALGAMGAGNTSVLMQLLVGMLDAALARCQDGLAVEQRNAVALKVDEAPLVLNRGFAETMALKRSAGLETVACWQTDSQWIDKDVRAQLDALFAHRVYFATASVQDARSAVDLAMAEFSDMVRPGIRNLSALGHPDVRLRLPRHSAIVSWVTPEGRQAPFVAHTLPLCIDEQRLALHAVRQAERGGRYLEDLSQPHWERSAPSKDGVRVKPGKDQRGSSENRECAGALSSHSSPALAGPPVGSSHAALPVRSSGSGRTEHLHQASSSRSAKSMDGSGTPPSLPTAPAESYRELVDLNAAHSVRWARSPHAPTTLEPEPLDLEILALLLSMRHVLSSQIHRRFNESRATTTTQRRLKRLSDAGLVARFQFHRRDGGGTPMCYSITPSGRLLSIEHGDSAASKVHGGQAPIDNDPSTSDPGPLAGESFLRQARHEVRTAGWVFALERALAGGLLALRGTAESAIAPSSGSGSGERMLTPADLCLPGARAPHDFLRTTESGSRIEVERFQSIRPDAILRTKEGHELFVELDDRLPEGSGAAKLERYDHFLSGWSTHVARYARPGAELPFVVFVCRDRSRARECARHADGVLTACRAYAGEYPRDWEYPGRGRIVYASERDAHEGLLCAWGVPYLPPGVRAVTEGDPRGRSPLTELRTDWSGCQGK